MRCGASDEKRDAATGQKNPAFGGPERLIGCPESFWVALCPPSGTRGSRIAPRAAPARMSRSGPSNDPIRSEDALEPATRSLGEAGPGCGAAVEWGERAAMIVLHCPPGRRWLNPSQEARYGAYTDHRR
jgi:hypothetical protein